MKKKKSCCESEGKLGHNPADIVKLNYAPITFTGVERSFSQYKSILRGNRRRLTFQHLKKKKKMFVTYCFGNRE